MKSKKALLYKIGTIVLLLAIAGTMFVIGRGHTVYFDNKTLELNGKTYKYAYKVVAYQNGEEIAKLFKRERGMATVIGQKFRMDIEVTNEKGNEPVKQTIELSLPYNIDGIVINLPAYLAGEGPEVYMSEFVPMTEEAPAEEEEVITDEFGLTDV